MRKDQLTLQNLNTLLTRDKEYPYTEMPKRFEKIFQKMSADIITFQELPNPEYKEEGEETQAIFKKTSENIKAEFSKKYHFFTCGYPSRNNMCDLGIALSKETFERAESYVGKYGDSKKVMLCAAGYLESQKNAEQVDVIITFTYHPSFSDVAEYIAYFPQIIKEFISQLRKNNPNKNVNIHDICLGFDSNAFNDTEYLKNLYHGLKRSIESDEKLDPDQEKNQLKIEIFSPHSWILLRSDRMFTQLYFACSKIGIKNAEQYISFINQNHFVGKISVANQYLDEYLKQIGEKFDSIDKSVVGRTKKDEFIAQLKQVFECDVQKLAVDFHNFFSIEAFSFLQKWLQNPNETLGDENFVKIIDALMVIKAHTMYAPVSKGAIVDVILTLKQSFVATDAILPPSIPHKINKNADENFQEKNKWLKALNEHMHPTMDKEYFSTEESGDQLVVNDPATDHCLVHGRIPIGKTPALALLQKGSKQRPNSEIVNGIIQEYNLNSSTPEKLHESIVNCLNSLHRFESTKDPNYPSFPPYDKNKISRLVDFFYQENKHRMGLLNQEIFLHLNKKLISFFNEKFKNFRGSHPELTAVETRSEGFGSSIRFSGNLDFTIYEARDFEKILQDLSPHIKIIEPVQREESGFSFSMYARPRNFRSTNDYFLKISSFDLGKVKIEPDADEQGKARLAETAVKAQSSSSVASSTLAEEDDQNKYGFK